MSLSSSSSITRNSAGWNAKHCVETHSQRFLFSSCSFFFCSTCLFWISNPTPRLGAIFFFFSIYKHISTTYSTLSLPLHLFFLPLWCIQRSSALSRYKSFEFHSEWEGGMERKKKYGKERRRFVSLARPYHWFNSSLSSAACDARNHNHPPFTYYTMPFPFFSFFLLLTRCTTKKRSFNFGLGCKENKDLKKNRIKFIQRVDESFVVVLLLYLPTLFLRLRFTFDHGTSTIRE